MAKSVEKILARKLRKEGQSIRKIAETLNVSRGSVSIWVRDVYLTGEQITALDLAQKRGCYIGRMKGAETQKRRRIQEIAMLRNEGIKQTGKLSKKEFFVSGVSIYWGEGSKSENECVISNSDPKMLVFMIKWFKTFFQVKNKDFQCQLGINESHEQRIAEIERKWSNILGIPQSQFTKASIKKAKSKKIFENSNQHLGALRIKVSKGTKIQRKILGNIEGLVRAG